MPKLPAAPMLEVLTPGALRAQLGLDADVHGAPAIGPVAAAVRSCVEHWRAPARARVTLYLHRQLIAAGFDEQAVRDRVADAIDALIDIGDITPARLDGKACLVLSRSVLVGTAKSDAVQLGRVGHDVRVAVETGYYARTAMRAPDSPEPAAFEDWLGPPDYRRHFARRAASAGDGAISEYWAALVSALRHDGNPIDLARVRALVAQPGSHNGHFGRHNLPSVTGRWATQIPEGTWCAVRPGRSEHEWHPIVVHFARGEAHAFDLFDWDEWTWALLARGAATGAPERSHWSAGTLAFEHPIPAQFVRGLRLLGGPGPRPWTWSLDEARYAAFDSWRQTWS